MTRARRMVSRAALGAAVVLVGGFATACGSDSDSGDGGSTNASNGSGGGTIGISQALNSNSTDFAITNALKAAAEKAGYKTLFTSADGDSSKQVSDIQSLMSRGVDGLIVLPVDSNAAVSVIENAIKQGTPVVTPNFGANSPEIYMNVQPSQTQMGEVQCAETGKALEGKGKVYYQAGNLNDLLGSGRWKGFKDCMDEKFPDIAVTMKESKWDSAAGANQIQTAFTASDFDGLVLASDGVYGPGAIAVLKQSGKLKPVGDPGHVFMIGIDGSPEGIKAIRDGQMDATVVQPFEQAASASIDYLVDAIDGKPRPAAGATDHDSEVVENEKGVWFDYIPAFVATKENIDDPKVWGNRASTGK